MSNRKVQPQKRHSLDHGEGSFYYATASGRWVGTLEAGTNERGKRRRIVVTDKDENAAWDKLRVKRKILELEGRAAALKGSQTVQAWVNDWLAVQEKRLRPSSFAGTRSYMRKWVIPNIGAVKLEDVTADHVRKVARAVLNAGKSSTTAGTVQGVCRSVCATHESKVTRWEIPRWMCRSHARRTLADGALCHWRMRTRLFDKQPCGRAGCGGLWRSCKG